MANNRKLKRKRFTRKHLMQLVQNRKVFGFYCSATGKEKQFYDFFLPVCDSTVIKIQMLFLHQYFFHYSLRAYWI